MLTLEQLELLERIIHGYGNMYAISPKDYYAARDLIAELKTALVVNAQCEQDN